MVPPAEAAEDDLVRRAQQGERSAADELLRRHYDRIYQRLIREVDFADLSSTFVMETFKSGVALPLDAS